MYNMACLHVPVPGDNPLKFRLAFIWENLEKNMFPKLLKQAFMSVSFRSYKIAFNIFIHVFFSEITGQIEVKCY